MLLMNLLQKQLLHFIYMNRYFCSTRNIISKSSLNVELSFSRIDFSQLAKPTNLQNSAVLRMLEEEEARQRGGQPGK